MPGLSGGGWRRMRAALVLLLGLGAAAAAPASALARESHWVEVTGHAAISGPEDRDSARRRALADALFQAALIGGAEVRGHTAVSQSVVTADLSIVRAIGRVLDHRILAQAERQGLWQVTIAARVGLGGDPFCPAPRRLPVSIYAPEIVVSPDAPAWAEPLARSLAADLIEAVDRHPATDLIRITDRAIPADGRAEGFDYTVLTQGSVRLQPGDIGFAPALRLSTTRGAFGDRLELEAELRLYDPDGRLLRQEFHSSAMLALPRALGRMTDITRRDRQAVSQALRKGLDGLLQGLLDQRACDPVTAVLQARGGKGLIVPVGRRHGLSRAALAFTTDRDHTTALLEIVALDGSQAELRSLDPNITPAMLHGRPVRFLEAAW